MKKENEMRKKLYKIFEIFLSTDAHERYIYIYGHLVHASICVIAFIIVQPRPYSNEIVV
jgi:hypothetical protein